jgi:hypothetical protein
MLTIDCDPIAVPFEDYPEVEMTLGDIINYIRQHCDRAVISRDDLRDVLDSAQDYYGSIHRGCDSEEEEYENILERLEERLYNSDEWEHNEVPVNTPDQSDDESGDPE